MTGARPWHSAMAATYAHATAPLRRLADRYVTEAALAIANGRAVPDWVERRFPDLPDVMNRAEARAAQVDGAVVELAEAVVLECRVGEVFEGRVVDIDDRGAKVQLCSEPVVTRVAGDGLRAWRTGRSQTRPKPSRTAADPVRRLIRSFVPSVVEGLRRSDVLALRSPLGSGSTRPRIAHRSASTATATIASHHLGPLQRLRILARKGQLAHPRPGRAGVDDVDPRSCR